MVVVFSFSALMSQYGAGYIQDMNFLGSKVWPRVKSVAYCHDSFSCRKYPASHPFPVRRQGTEHLGEVYDQFSVGRAGDVNIIKRAPVNADCIPSSTVDIGLSTLATTSDTTKL